ncbi:hypothetical protein TNCV_1750391 [Trichonephila clavipes]|nr:hypothetical protein TNCV_1750391 [Trichonephila clavipes]
MANWSQCPKFPKTKPKKGDALNDRNKNNINENRPTFNSNKATPNVSYANAAKNEQQMAAQKPVSEPATNSSESNTEPKNQHSTPCSDIFLATANLETSSENTRTHHYWESPQKCLFRGGKNGHLLRGNGLIL